MATGTTTSDDVLARLQSAWRKPIAAEPTAVAVHAPTASCGAHNTPADYVLAPDRYERPGWHAVSCRHCGGFIGYRPPEGDKP